MLKVKEKDSKEKEKEIKEENKEKENPTTIKERVNTRSHQMCVGIVARVDIIKRIVGRRMVKIVQVVSKSGNSKGGAKNGKSSVEVQDNPEPETEQSYLELAMVVRAEDATGGTADSADPSSSARPPVRRPPATAPRAPAPKARPAVLDIPENFPDVGGSEMVRRLAYQRDKRLTENGQPRDARANWREMPTTKYRQQAMVFAEASRLRGSMREELIKRITIAEGIDQACSSCDERYKVQMSSAAQYASKHVARMYAASVQEGVYMMMKKAIKAMTMMTMKCFAHHKKKKTTRMMKVTIRHLSLLETSRNQVMLKSLRSPVKISKRLMLEQMLLMKMLRTIASWKRPPSMKCVLKNLEKALVELQTKTEPW